VTALQTTSTRDALVAEVRRLILGGELPPGAPLTETMLASRFGVARPTIRSALQELVARNLAQRANGRSLIVPVLTEADIHDLFLIRTPLELEAVRVIVESGTSLARPERILAEMDALAPDASWADRVEIHTEFHIALVELAGSPRLNRIYPALQEEMQLCLAQLHNFYPGGTNLADEHRRLLAAIAAGDVAAAQAEMREHLSTAVRHLAVGR
jgi:DNA-binding GntR family transcriptional regulator